MTSPGPTKVDWDEEPKDNGELLVQEGTRRLLEATSDLRRREAIIMWLRGAIAAVDEFVGGSMEGSPGTVLLAALKDLNNGITPPLLKAKPGGTRQRTDLARAKARAVAAVEIMLELQQANGLTRNVRSAIKAVAHMCGIAYGSLRSLRAHVKAGNGKHAAVTDLVDEERANLLEDIRQFELMGLDANHALVTKLREDRALLA